MIVSHDRNEYLIHGGQDGDVYRIEWLKDDCDIALESCQGLLGGPVVGDIHAEFYIGVSTKKGVGLFSHKSLGSLATGDGHFAALHAGEGDDLRIDPSQVRILASHPTQQQFACSRQTHPGWMTFENRRPEIVFDILNAPQKR